MSRYIDANKLKKSLSIPCASIIEIGETIIAQIDDQPTADVVEVVRCKDCKHNPKDTWSGKENRWLPIIKYKCGRTEAKRAVVC